MSVKALLPIVGVGSAFALLRLAVARKPRVVTPASAAGAAHPTGKVGGLGEPTALEPLPGAAPLAPDFWNAAPEPRASSDVAGPEPRGALTGLGDLKAYAEPAGDGEAPPRSSWPHAARSGEKQRRDKDGWGAEWLARATQASSDGSGEVDDPAEIPADSLSMISEASRHAASFDPFEADAPSERERP